MLLDTTAPGASHAELRHPADLCDRAAPRLAVTAADVNGDGKPDLIVTNPTDNTVSVLLNTTAPGAGKPGFATAADLRHGHNQLSVDGGGRQRRRQARPDRGEWRRQHDLGAAQHYRPGRLTQQLRHPADFATGTEPISVIAADINGDGKPDLIVRE